MSRVAALKGTSVVPKTTVVPHERRPVVGRRAQSEREAAAELSAILHHYSAGQLAQITGCSKDAAKKWRAGDSCPNTPNTIRLGQEIPGVRNWILSGLNCALSMPAAPEVSSLAQDVMTLIMQEAQTGTGQRAAMARATLSKLLKSE